MELKYFKNIKQKEYELILSGGIGEEINCIQIANEIRYLNSIGATKITERINSPGGYVLDGYDIVDANLNSTAIIETIITGLAASTAGWLAATGTKGYRQIVDYGKGMIHDPSLGSNKIEDLPDGPDKEGLISIKDSISTILSNNSNLNKAKINDMMTKETWLSANEWVEFGFADKIISTGRKMKENLSMLEFMNACEDLNDKNEIKMKSLTNFFNLSEDAQEASILKEVQNLSKRANDAEGKVENLESEIEGLKNDVSNKDSEISNLKTKVEDFEKKEKENAVNAAIDSKKFDEDQRDDLNAQIDVMGVENFNKMVNMVKLPSVNVIEQIKNTGEKGEKKTTDQKLAEEYQNLADNDPMELRRIKNEEPSRFEKMLNAWNEN